MRNARDGNSIRRWHFKLNGIWHQCGVKIQTEKLFSFFLLFGARNKLIRAKFSFTLSLLVFYTFNNVLSRCCCFFHCSNLILSCQKRTCGWPNHLINVWIESMAQHSEPVMLFLNLTAIRDSNFHRNCNATPIMITYNRTSNCTIVSLSFSIYTEYKRIKPPIASFAQALSPPNAL